MADNTNVEKDLKQRSSEVDTTSKKSEEDLDKAIESISERLSDIRKKALENFKDENGKVIPEGELTKEQAQQLEDSIKSEVQGLYSEKKELVSKTINDRNDRLNEIAHGENGVDALVVEAEKKIEELQSEISKLDEEISKAEGEEKEKLEQEKNSKIKERDDLKGIMESVKSKLKTAFSKNQAVADRAILGMKEGFKDYSYIDVDNDKDIGYRDENGEYHGGLLKKPLGEELRKQVDMDEERIANTEKYNELQEELKGLDPEKDRDRIEQINNQMKELKNRCKDPKQYEKIKAGLKRNKELLKYAPEAPNKENIENGDKVELGDKVEQKEQTTATPKQNMNITPEMAAQIAKAMAAQKATQEQPTQAVQTEDTPVAGDELEDVEPKDFLAMLGYEEGTEINFTNSKDILEKFMNNPDISDRVRMKMINDPNCKDVILDCLRTAGKNKKIGKEFNATRRKILDFAKGPLMAETLKDIGAGEEYYDMGRKEFDNLDLTYREEINNLELQLKKASITPEEKQSIENTINEYEAIRTKINNAREFQRNADYIKTFGTRIQDAKDFVFKKFGLNKKALNPAREETTVKTSVDNKDTKAADDKQKDDVQKTEPEREEAQPSWKNAVKSEEEKDKAAAQRMENEKEDKAKNEIEKDDMQI